MLNFYSHSGRDVTMFTLFSNLDTQFLRMNELNQKYQKMLLLYQNQVNISFKNHVPECVTNLHYVPNSVMCYKKCRKLCAMS